MPNVADLRYQQQILARVSRTFALTIPQLPPGLHEVVANAYLLCRLADTIEDDPHLPAEEKARFMSALLAALRGSADPEEFARRLGARLSTSMSAAEHELVANAPRLLRITGGFSAPRRQALIRCLSTMAAGMPEFQRHGTLDGLASLSELDRYCYVVAGVVGEMLTELFCDYCPELQPKRATLMKLAVRFGQGLQMTNILKDIWEDREAQRCWLPRNLFAHVNGGLGSAMRRRDHKALAGGIVALLAVTRGHLSAALRYTQLLPKSEPGLRRFCLWAIGIAVLTLRNIQRNPHFSHSREVKISRRLVRTVACICNLALYSNHALSLLFAAATRSLPAAGVVGPWTAGAGLASDAHP